MMKKLSSKSLQAFVSYVAIQAIVPNSIKAQNIFSTDNNEFRVSGYIRSGLANDEAGHTPVGLQMPGALNKFSLGNQPDTYTELEFDYKHYLNAAKTKSVELRWMSSYYETFATKDHMNFNPTEQLYIRLNNLLGFEETIWFGKRFYDRYAIHMLDRQWLNPGQKGWGFGMENLLPSDSGQDIKWGIWQMKNKDVVSYKNMSVNDDLVNYKADVRWVKIPVSSKFKANFALNYTFRPHNESLGYDARHGFGAFAWLDYKDGKKTNTLALLYRKGVNISKDHWTGVSLPENSENDNVVTADLKKAYSLELNNNFLYDNEESFAVNVIFMGVYKDYGTAPMCFENGSLQRLEQQGSGSTVAWLALGARPIFYITKQFRLTSEVSHELIRNKSVGASGNMSKFTFTPEFSLSKGFYSVPVLRPFVTYARWSDSLKGHIASSSSRWSRQTHGFIYGLQFEIWW